MNALFQTRALRQEFYEVVAVDDVDLAIAPGQIFGLIGPNGAGKTTLLRMLATTLSPTAGEVLFEGRNVWDDPCRLRGRIGFMPDFFLMYPKLTVRELLTYFGIAHGMRGRPLRQRVEEVLTLVDLRDKRDAFVRGLSRGMMQRLGVGRAILHRPAALLLDEPASGLDPLSRRDLFDLLRRSHAEGATIVISSHILTELTDLCTAVGIMHNGRIVESGTVEDIRRRLMPYRKISLRVARGLEAASSLLPRQAGVTEVQARPDGLDFRFTGTDRELGELNTALVQAGVCLVTVEEARASLHELYFAVAEGAEHAASA